MIEDELRRAMQAGTQDVSPSRERLFKAQLEASKRRRRRDTVAAAVSSSALSIVAVLLLASVAPPSTDEAPAEQVNLAAQVETEITVAPSKITAGRPRTLAAASSAGRLVLIDPQAGNTTRVLTTLKDPTDGSKGGLLGGVALSADATKVFFDAKTTETCGPEIRVIATSGGNAAAVTKGSLPAVSPDGSRIALVRNNGCEGAAIIVRSIAQGTEQTLISGVDAVRVASLSWSPSGNALVADIRRPQATSNSLYVYPSNVPGDFSAGRVIAPPTTSTAGTVWEYASYVADGRIFVSERCCASSAGDTAKSSRMIVVDPDDTNAIQLIAFGIVTKTHTGTASDESGAHLLYLSGQDLMASDQGARPNVLARGLLGAAWR